MVYRNNHYWMYSKHSIENALLNPNRKVFELLLEDDYKPKAYNGLHYKSKKLDRNGPYTGKIEVHQVHEFEK